MAYADKYKYVADYVEWSKQVFGKPIAPLVDYENIKSVSTFAYGSKYFDIAAKGIFDAEMALVADLLLDIKQNNVAGDIAEFGVFEGGWLNRLYDLTVHHTLLKTLYGFDSFEGLSEPNATHDVVHWEKGMFSAGLEKVQKNLKTAERPRIKLIPGWFAQSLATSPATDVKAVCYARIDCDIYDPAVDCLRYLGPRLAHGSVLVFDDWAHNKNFGETRAFAEWVPTVPHLEFQFLYHGTWDHFYMRVWHKRQPRFAAMAGL